MDESALKTLLDNLDRSQSSLHHWLHFWIFLVVVGVALEVVFVVWEYAEDLHNFRRGIVQPPEKPSTSLLVLGLLGAGLVAVGVAGELYIDVQAGKVETEIRHANELRVSLLSKEASEARERAGQANERASKNEKEAARLHKEAEAEHLARVRLQEDIAPRRLALPERTKLSAKVAEFAGIVALIQYGSGDTESYAFGEDMGMSLSMAHWRPTDPMEVLMMREGPLPFGTFKEFPIGVNIEACPNELSRNAAKSVRDGLTALGFNASIDRDNCNWVQMLGPQNKSLTNPAGIHITIRPRPEGPQGAAKLRHDMAHNSSSANQ